MDNNPEKRKRGDHTHIVDRNKLNKKNHTVFNENEARILNSFKINPLVKNFNDQNLKERKYPEPIDLSCPLFKKIILFYHLKLLKNAIKFIIIWYIKFLAY